jgi:plasmid stabilization system protein ParE
MYKLIISDDAKADIQKAYYYLEEERVNSGEKLLNRIDSLLEIIQNNPKLFIAKHRNVRQIRVTPFQYLILYKIYGKRVLFFQLFHGKQHPARRKIT